jgi:2-polyprenyl-3-methyl-5-hydroxy-6-metoxy-1,4-benzoquinol methylase
MFLYGLFAEPWDGHGDGTLLHRSPPYHNPERVSSFIRDYWSFGGATMSVTPTSDCNSQHEQSSTAIRCCPICQCDNSGAPLLAYSRSPWNLKGCGKCGFVYLENPPQYEVLSNDLAWEKTWVIESARRRRINPVLNTAARSLRESFKRRTKRDKLVSRVRRYLQPGPVLDVGCGSGNALECLPSQFIPYGIEVSEELGRQAAQRYSARGGQVVTGAAISMTTHFAEDFFSGVIMSSFLEHEVNISGVLAAARCVMRRTGRLIIKVPNYSSLNRLVMGANWCGFRFPEHVNYFTPEMLRRSLNVSGFRVLRFGLLDRFPTKDSMWCIAERS